MGRYTDFSIAKVPVASTTTVFTSSEITADLAAAYTLVCTGVNVALGAQGIKRLRVKWNGATLYDVAQLHYRAFIERFSASNIALGLAAAFTIPFFFPDAEREDIGDSCQFPPGGQIQLELDHGTDALSGGPTIVAVKQEAQVAPLFMPRLYGMPMNIATGQTNATALLQDDGMIRGIGLHTVGLVRARVVLGGRLCQHIPGVNYTANAGADGLKAVQQLNNGITLTDPVFLKIDHGLNAPQGNSYVMVDTGNGGTWAGVANEMTVYSISPLRRA